ncbi:MAG: cytidylate kinase-like family protein [Deltaproteobacteria bacterium]|nr:cytidylate kinase-like family protein [Deltaproteobacteria bacterium]
MTSAPAVPTSRSKELLIEEQIRKWQLANERRRKSEPRPTITISREMGSRGTALGRKIAETLGFDFFDREIIQAVAESMQMSEQVVASLDERMRSSLEHWIQILKSTRFLWPDKYRQHLTKVVGAIAEHGSVVIMGRGANYLLPEEETLRVRFVGSLAYRVDIVAERENISKEEAERRVRKSDEERQAYVKDHFAFDINDPSYFDLIINTEYLTAETIVKIVASSLKFKKHPARRRFDEKE